MHCGDILFFPNDSASATKVFGRCFFRISEGTPTILTQVFVTIPPGKCQVNTWNRSLRLPYKSFLIHQSFVNLPVEAILSGYCHQFKRTNKNASTDLINLTRLSRLHGSNQNWPFFLCMIYLFFSFLSAYRYW
jgi:hypothetical protein